MMDRLLLLALVIAVATATEDIILPRSNNHHHHDDKGVTGGRRLSILDYGAIPDADAKKKSVQLHFPEFFENASQTDEILISAERRRLLQSDKDRTVLSLANKRAFNKALADAQPGDTVVVPEGHTFTLTGGITAADLYNVTIDFAGSIHFVHDLDVWPRAWWRHRGVEMYQPAISIFNSSDILITCSASDRASVHVNYKVNMVYFDPGTGSGGIINGNGKGWWDDALAGQLPDRGGDSRPRLMTVLGCANVVIENLTLINSPFWTLRVRAARAQIRRITVLVDRRYQTALAEYYYIKNQDPELDLPWPSPVYLLPDWVARRLRQPQNLNTDGIDVAGVDILVSDCIIQNADDCVAIKGSYESETILEGQYNFDCTRNVTIKDMVLTGFGATIGSVGPKVRRKCVDNVTFHNITMPGTGKGIYIKSDGSDCSGGVSAQISNVLYQDINIIKPFWWPIWIGPQQQHQPNTQIGLKCPLAYPLPGSHQCPSPSCVDFENITLRNVFIYDPFTSPGVILGNASNPMRNIKFENVVVQAPTKKWWRTFYRGRWPFHEHRYPFRGKYHCQFAHVECVDKNNSNCHPMPFCENDPNGALGAGAVSMFWNYWCFGCLVALGSMFFGMRMVAKGRRRIHIVEEEESTDDSASSVEEPLLLNDRELAEQVARGQAGANSVSVAQGCGTLGTEIAL